MGIVLDLAEVGVVQGVERLPVSRAALAASWSTSLVPMSAINEFLGDGGDGKK